MAQKHRDPEGFITDSVTAPDGAKIGYRVTGTGPGLILVHGALQSSLNFTRLAKALSDNFTVYVPDRRGRGLSDAYRDSDNLLTEARDIITLVNCAGAHAIFGLSSGAIITLQAALLEPSVKKIALYEPPIPLNEHTFKKLETDYEKAIHNGKLGRAFIAILKGTGDDSFFTSLPAWLTAPLFNWLIKAQQQKKQPGDITLGDLVPTFRQDGIVTKDAFPLIQQAAQLKAGVLLMQGEKSKPFLKSPLDMLEAVLPKSRRVEFKGQGHIAADNSGDPVAVAQELLSFFKEP